MQFTGANDSTVGQSMEQSIDTIFSVLQSFIGVNTLFVAINDGKLNTVMKSFNRDAPLIAEGLQLPLSDTYCHLVFQQAGDSGQLLHIADTEAHPATCGLAMNRTLGRCAFVGVPIGTEQRPNFGTLCALHPGPYTFTERELSLLETMAGYLGQQVQLGWSENRLKRLTDQNLMLLQSVSEGIYGIDLEGRTIFWNAAAERMTGFTAAEMIGANSHDLIHHTDTNGSELPLANCTIYKALGSKVTRTVTSERFWRKDGTSFPVEYTINPMIDSSDGCAAGLVVTFRDMTDARRTEELLLKSEKLSVVGQLAAGVAHEIRNPLTAVYGFAKLIRSRAPELDGYFNIMLDELNRIETIVNEFLFLSKPQIHHFQYRDIRAILRGLLPIIESQAIMGNVLIRLKMGDGFIPEMLCDERRMKQVFLNVLRNAIEAMPNGGEVTVTLSYEQSCGMVRIMVRDEGIGIAKERLARIGEPFYTTKEVGTGLGLMVSCKIIEAHHGKFGINSELGKGTTVTIELPVPGPNAPS